MQLTKSIRHGAEFGSTIWIFAMPAIATFVGTGAAHRAVF
jgi:hypothetical protein